MSDPIALAVIGLAVAFALIFLHVPIGIALGLIGVAGFAMFVGVQPALSLLANEPASVIINLDLAVIPLFLLMGSPSERGELDRFEGAPASMDDIGFVKPVDRFGERIVVGIADAADGRLDARFGQALGVSNADVFGGFMRS